MKPYINIWVKGDSNMSYMWKVTKIVNNFAYVTVVFELFSSYMSLNIYRYGEIKNLYSKIFINKTISLIVEVKVDLNSLSIYYNDKK